MGDFDRNKEAKPVDQSKQIKMVIALGLVLVVVVVYTFGKKGPQAAVAMSNAGEVGEPNLVLSPDEAKALLEKDPAAGLLLNANVADHSMDTPPHNPFAMDSRWRASLIREKEPVPVAVPRHADPVPEVVRTPLTLRPEDFKLASIIRQGTRMSAILNGQIVTVGMVIDGARVLDIQEQVVTLQNAEAADGPRIQLKMDPKLK